MLQLRKSITSKSVILLIIFLTSTTFGFLEKTNRDYESRRSFRVRSVSVDRDFTEEMPFRRDISRRANEKDIIYENLYDRRSFRTGTDRHIRNEDRERISKIQDRNLEERSTFSNPDNSRNRQQSYRLLDNRPHQDRSRSFTQTDRTIRFDRTSERRSGIDMNTRHIRQHRERNVDIRDRVLDERRIRENTDRELINRENVNIRSKYLSGDNNRERERNVDNKNEFVSRINYRRNEATQNLRLDRNLRAIPARSFGDERYPQQEINSRRNSQRLEDREANFKNYRIDDARQQIEQQSRRSLSRFSRSVETPVNHERSLEKRDRRFLDNDREDNRRQNERFVDKRIVQDTRDSRGLRSVNFYRESRERLPMTIQDAQNVRVIRSREQRERESFNRSSRKYNINENRLNRESSTRLSRESRIRYQRNRNPSTDRFSRVIRDDSRRTSRFVLGTSENRYLNERSLARDRAVPNRGYTSRNDVYRAGLSRSDSARQILDARINSQPLRNVEYDSTSSGREIADRRLPTATNENRLNRESSTRLSRESRIRDQRNRNPSTDRFSGVIRDDSRRTSRFVLGTSENRHLNERSLARDRVVLNRGHTSRNDVYRAGLSRSDSARQILDARINSQPLRNVEYDSTSSGREIADRRLPTATNARLRETEMRSLKSIDRRIVPVVEYSSNVGRSSDRIVDNEQREALVSNFKFNGLANVIQVILGVYLIGQIFAHSSKKIPFGYRRLLPSLSSIKDKLE